MRAFWGLSVYSWASLFTLPDGQISKPQSFLFIFFSLNSSDHISFQFLFFSWFLGRIIIPVSYTHLDVYKRQIQSVNYMKRRLIEWRANLRQLIIAKKTKRLQNYQALWQNAAQQRNFHFKFLIKARHNPRLFYLTKMNSINSG